MNLMRPRFLLAWAVVMLVLAVVVIVVRGPFLLERRVELDLSARSAGTDWALEWLGSNGDLRNGRWLDIAPASGTFATTIQSPLPNHRFSTLALRWRGMPGVQVDNPKSVTLVDRVLWWDTRTELSVQEGVFDGVKLADGVYTSEAPDGGLAWAMPMYTAALALDVAVLWAVMLAGWLVVWTAYHLKDGGGWYTPERGAIALVLLVHTWFAVRAPLMYCPDSMDYFVNAKLLAENRTFDHFSTWRLPGYSVFLSPMVGGLHRFNLAIGIAQGLLAVATAWMAGRTVRAFLPAAWGALALLIVGLDPVLLAYARHAMPECLAAFLLAATAWAAVQHRLWASDRVSLNVLGAMGLGLLLAAACYVRGNLLVAAGLVPFAIAAWAVAEGQWRRGVLAGLVCLVTAGACVTPWVLRTKRMYDRAEFVVGTGYTRAISLADAAELDLNQEAVFSRHRWEQLRAKQQAGQLGGQATMGQMGLKEDAPLSKRLEGLHSWTARDEASGYVADESVSRQPTRRWIQCVRAFVNLTGLWPIQPESQDNEHWSRALRQWEEPGLNHRSKPEAYTYLKAEHTQNIYDRSLESTATWARSDQAEVYGRLWTLAACLRPLWAALVIVGTLCAVGRRQWAMALLGALVLGHAGVLAAHLLTGIDRYQVPMFPVMSVLAVYALASLAGAAPMARGPNDRLAERLRSQPRDSRTRLDR